MSKNGHLILAIAVLVAYGCALNKPIQVKSDPAGADVFVDGKKVGATPIVLTTDDLMPRRAYDGKPSTKAMIVIEKPGYKSYQLVVKEFAIPKEINAELEATGTDEGQDAASNDLYDRLERLQKLREEGAITEEEFQELKRRAMEKSASGQE